MGKNILLLYMLCAIILEKSWAQSSDSLSQTSVVYTFRPQLTLNLLRINRGRDVSNSGKEPFRYTFREFSASGYYPVKESKFYSKNNNYQKSLTILCTGSLSRSVADFSFIETRPIVRLSAGVRILYNSGPKNIWMAGLSPFIAENEGSVRNAIPRFFANILYTRMVSEYFSYRLGLSYTYLFNGGALLPILGFRVGSYKGLFLNFQIPRDISLVWTINNNWQTGIFTRLSGGIYRFRESTLSRQIKGDEANLVFYRTDFLNGIMINYSPNFKYYFSLNAGIAHNRSVNLALTNELIPTKGHIYIDEMAQSAGFVNLSFSVYFGKPTYSGSYNYLIEQKAVNNSFDAGNFNIGGNQITQDMNRVDTRDLRKKDLKNMNDRYLDVKDFLLDE